MDVEEERWVKHKIFTQEVWVQHENKTEITSQQSTFDPNQVDLAAKL